MLLLIGGQDQTVLDWASAVLNKKFVQPASAFGITDENGLLKGAAIFNDYYKGGNIEMTYIGAGTFSRSIMKGLARYAFTACQVSRVTLKTQRANLVVRKLLKAGRLGWQFEGVIPRYFGPTKQDDALTFVLYKHKAPKWMMEG